MISGIIEGFVCSSTRSAITDVYVRIVELNFYYITDKNGFFCTENIPMGIYSLEFNHISYNTHFVKDIDVTEDGISEIDTVFLDLLIYDLEKVTITAEGLDPARQNNSLSSNTVLENQIKERNAKSSAEVLREETGITVQKTTHGGGSAIIRGLSSNQILLLVDGIRVNNSTYRLGNHQYLTTIDNLAADRIEVIRGPTSVSFGSDAMGGTINVITKKPRLNPHEFSKSFSLYSRYATVDAEKTIRGEAKLSYRKIGFLAGFSFKKYNDLKRGKNSEYPELEKSTNGLKQTPSGFSSSDMDMKILYAITPLQILSLAYQQTNQNNVPRYDKYENNGYFLWRYHPQSRKMLYLKYDNLLNRKYLSSLDLTISFQEQSEGRKIQKNINSERTNEEDKVRTIGLSLTGKSEMHKQIITFGGEIYSDWINSDLYIKEMATGKSVKQERGLYPDGARYTSLGLFLQDQIEVIDSVFITTGLRYNSAFTNFVLPTEPEIADLNLNFSALVGQLGCLFALNNYTQLKLNIGQAFRAPNLSDLSKLGESKGEVFEVPNYNLRPEKVISFDFGVNFAFNKISVQSVAFYTSISDLVASADDIYNNSSILILDSTIYKIKSKQNIGKAFIRGLESDVNFNFYQDFLLYAKITSIFGENTSLNEPVGGIPPTFGLLGLRWKKNKYHLEIYYRFADKQDRLSADDKDDPRIPPNGTPGWSILNFNAAYEYLNLWILRFSIENIFDKNYREHGSGINGPGRNFIFSLGLNI